MLPCTILLYSALGRCYLKIKWEGIRMNNEITPEAKERLRENVEILKKNGTSKIEIIIGIISNAYLKDPNCKISVKID
jgi:hypothetical protein